MVDSRESEDAMGGGDAQRTVLCVYEPKKTGAHSAEKPSAHKIHYAATKGLGTLQTWCVDTGPKGATKTFLPYRFFLNVATL